MCVIHHLGLQYKWATDYAGFSKGGHVRPYQLGGGLNLGTALEKTQSFSEFLQQRMTQALELQDPSELHYVLAQLDDYHSYMWRYYERLQNEKSQRPRFQT